MSIGVDQVRHLAHLARLALSDDEVQMASEQVSEILDYADMIRTLDTEAIPPTAQVVPHRGVLRDDVVEPSLTIEQVLANAPEARDGQFVVSAVLSGDLALEDL
ncbi:MAG: Asp-tRNA(Asn)/Glu-tRNA(Gln) amidotransferase subunit GatC [Anaerolineae bacterium]